LDVRTVLVLKGLLYRRDLIGLHFEGTDLHAPALGHQHLRLWVSHGRHDLGHLADRRRRRVAHVEPGAALELDARLQAAEEQEDESRHDEQTREREIERLALDDVQHQDGTGAARCSRASGARSSTPYSRRWRSEA